MLIALCSWVAISCALVPLMMVTPRVAKTVILGPVWLLAIVMHVAVGAVLSLIEAPE